MRRLTALAFAAALGVASAAAPEAAQAQATQTIRCESQGGDLRNCEIPNLDQNSVRLVRRLSQTQCVNGRTWGTMPGIIWVESGCRAEFEYRTMSGGGYGDRGRMEITCESEGNNRHACLVDNLDLGSVRLEENVSRTPCNRDQNWGTQRNNNGTQFWIWVDDGCRGVFSYRVNDSRPQGNPFRGGRRDVVCESQGNGRHACVIRNLDLGSVRLEENISRTPCNKDQNWGTQRNRAGTQFWIWVDDGCRARFSYRVNN